MSVALAVSLKGGFGTLAGHFADRTVVTYDPRGVERSKKADDSSEYTPDRYADDLHRLISALGTGPVDLFVSSGGAMNALAHVARHPEQVRTLVAHEPPAAQVLPDRDGALAASRDVGETYQRSGSAPGPHDRGLTFTFCGHPRTQPHLGRADAGRPGGAQSALRQRLRQRT